MHMLSGMAGGGGGTNSGENLSSLRLLSRALPRVQGSPGVGMGGLMAVLRGQMLRKRNDPELHKRQWQEAWQAEEVGVLQERAAALGRSRNREQGGPEFQVLGTETQMGRRRT